MIVKYRVNEEKVVADVHLKGKCTEQDNDLTEGIKAVRSLIPVPRRACSAQVRLVPQKELRYVRYIQVLVPIAGVCWEIFVVENFLAMVC